MVEHQTPHYKCYTTICMVYATILIISVLFPYRIIDFFNVNEPVGVFILPLNYILGCAIAEVYGRKLALKMMWSSIFCLFLSNLIIYIVVRLPSGHSAGNQQIFYDVFGSSMRFFFACFIGLVFSDLTNIYRITRLKLIFKGKYFIQRSLWVSMISEAIFNIITYTLCYFDKKSLIDIGHLIIYSWVFKVVYSLLLVLPLLYLMKFLKRVEKIDIYDVTSLGRMNSEEVLLKFLNGSNKASES